MKYSSVIVEELATPRSSRFLPRCILLGFVTGIVFYSLYSVLPIPVSIITSGRLESGSPPCECVPDLPPVPDRGRLFYNRVPKCGSTTLLTLMRRLAAKNDFVHVNSKVYDRKNIGDEEQRRLVKLIKSTGPPCSFDRHVFFINFTRFDETPPLYINVVRDPVERIISSFFYRRMMARQNRTKVKPSDYWLNKKFEHCVLTPDPECTFVEGHSYNSLQLSYFCGHDPECQLLDDPTAMQKAKYNIEKHYSVVGTLEDINMTLQVLEATLPRFFHGAYKVYHTLGVHLNQNLDKEQVREEVKEILRSNLTSEYELYHFVQQRLYRQYQSILQESENHPVPDIHELLDYR